MPSSTSLTLLVLLASSGLQSKAISTFAQGPSGLPPDRQQPHSPRGAGERGWGRGCTGGRGPGSPSLLFYAEGAGPIPLLTHAVIAAKRLTDLSLRIHCSLVPPS